MMGAPSKSLVITNNKAKNLSKRLEEIHFKNGPEGCSETFRLRTPPVLTGAVKECEPIYRLTRGRGGRAGYQ